MVLPLNEPEGRHGVASPAGRGSKAIHPPPPFSSARAAGAIEQNIPILLDNPTATAKIPLKADK